MNDYTRLSLLECSPLSLYRRMKALSALLESDEVYVDKHGNVSHVLDNGLDNIAN